MGAVCRGHSANGARHGTFHHRQPNTTRRMFGGEGLHCILDGFPGMFEVDGGLFEFNKQLVESFTAVYW